MNGLQKYVIHVHVCEEWSEQRVQEYYEWAGIVCTCM